MRDVCELLALEGHTTATQRCRRMGEGAQQPAQHNSK